MPLKNVYIKRDIFVSLVWRFFETKLPTIDKQLQFRLSKQVEIEGKV